jgi:hypothetical protein
MLLYENPMIILKVPLSKKGNYGKTLDILIQYLSMFRKDYYRVFNDVETKQGE